MKIGVLKKKDFTAVSHYRLAPWIVLGKFSNSQVILIDPKSVSVYELRTLNVLIAHAPATELEYQILTQARGYGVRIIIDYDDLLHGIEDHNPAAQYWGKDDVIERSTEMILQCDLLTVSTPELQAQFFSRFGKESQVIPNALDDNAFSVWPKPAGEESVLGKRKLKVLWRGSNTHSADLYMNRELFQDYSHIDWYFFGYNPLIELSGRYAGELSDWNYIKGRPAFVDYMVKLLAIRPDFVVVPLEDTTFNQCKSNIAWIEATWAGAMCVAPGYMGEFNRDGVLNYWKPGERVFDSIAANDLPALRETFLNVSRENIENNLLLSKVNQSRAEALALALEGRGV